MKTITEIVTTGSDEECIEAFVAFLPRVRLSAELLEQDGVYYGKVLHILCGDYLLTSRVTELPHKLVEIIGVENA